MFRARKRPRRFVKESLRFADYWVQRHPNVTGLNRDVAQQFVPNNRKPLSQKSEAIFVERIGPNNTHPERFPRGVDKHPHFGSYVEGTPGDSAKGGFYAVFHRSIRDSRVGRDL